MDGDEEPKCNVPGVSREPIFKGDYSFNTGKVPSPDGFDWSIVIAIISVTIGITVHLVWKHRKRTDIDDYLLAGRSVSWLSAGSSLLAGYFSGITLLGIPRLMYTDSCMEIWNILSDIMAVFVSVHLFVPVLWNLRITSVYEYLEKRFNRKVRTIGSLYFIIMTLVFLSMVLYSPSISLSAVTHIDVWVAIISIGCLCVTYTTLGGMRAVIYTDTFLLVVLLLSILCVLIKGLLVVGGFGAMWRSGRRSNRIIFNLPFDLKENESFNAIVVSGFAYSLASLCANQYNLHRLLCCRTEKDARKAIEYILIPGVVYITGFSALIGLTAAAFYENCDPIQTETVSDAEQLLPLFVMDTMSDVIGLPGLFIAGVLSATLSTVSSGLNSIATVTLEDFFRVYIWDHIDGGRARIITQVLTVFFGSVCLEFTFFASKMEGALFQIDAVVNGALGAPLFCVFFMGVLFPWVTSKAALWSLLGGAAFNVIMILLRTGLTEPDTTTPATPCISNCNITVFSQKVQTYLYHPTTPMPREGSDSHFLDAVSVRYYSVIGFLVTLAIGLIVSRCTATLGTTGSHHEPVDPALIVPVLDEMFPCYYLPESIRHKCRFGLDHTDKWEKWYTKQKELAERKDREITFEEPEVVATQENSVPASNEMKETNIATPESSVRVSNAMNETYI